MKKNEVKIGNVYSAKVTNKVVSVRIDAENPHGGWDATNLATKKKVRIKSVQRLRSQVKDKSAKEPPTSAPVEKQATKSSRDTKAAKKANVGAPGAKLAKTAAKPKRPSGLDAAARILAETNEPLSCKTMVNMMLEKGYWKTSGQTPSATIYAAIIREISKKGNASRFRKIERGKFTLNQRQEG